MQYHYRLVVAILIATTYLSTFYLIHIIHFAVKVYKGFKMAAKCSVARRFPMSRKTVLHFSKDRDYRCLIYILCRLTLISSVNFSSFYLESTYLSQVNNGNIRTKHKIPSRLIVSHRRHSCVLIIKFVLNWLRTMFCCFHCYFKQVNNGWFNDLQKGF